MFFGSCAWVPTSFLLSVNDLSPLQVDSIPGLSWQGQWPPPKLAAWAALPQCPSCLPCLHKVLCHALDNAPHPVCPWAWEHAADFGTWHHTHKADLYKLLPMDQNGTSSSPILLAYLLTLVGYLFRLIGISYLTKKITDRFIHFKRRLEWISHLAVSPCSSFVRKKVKAFSSFVKSVFPSYTVSQRLQLISSTYSKYVVNSKNEIAWLHSVST